MYDSQNLPLSPLKVVKKTIRRWLFWALFVLPFLYLSISSWYGISMFGVAFLLLLPIMFVIVIYEYYYYKLYYYNFAEDRAEIRKGVISRATGHVHYERLQNIYIDQDFLDRIFRLYDIHYETAGKTSDFYSHVDGLNKINADK